MSGEHIAIHLARGWVSRAGNPDAADAWLANELEAYQSSLIRAGVPAGEARRMKLATRQACIEHLSMQTDPRARSWFAHEAACRYKRLYEVTQSAACALLAVEVAALRAAHAGLAAREVHALIGGIRAAIHSIT